MQQPTAYGDSMADIYDMLYPHTPDVDHCANFIAALAGDGGSVLELGVGTGRLSFPLVERGLLVDGVDASTRIMDRLREKDVKNVIANSADKNDPTPRLILHQGDFTSWRTERTFDVVVLALNTLFAIPEVEQQVSTLRRMCEHVKPGGHVVLETFDPLPYHQQSEPSVTLHNLPDNQVMLDKVYVSRWNQMLLITHTLMGEGRPQTFMETARYAWPAELDLMARTAGLGLSNRYAGWMREPFNDLAPRVVSCYQPLPDDIGQYGA